MQNESNNQPLIGSTPFGKLNGIQGETARRRFKLTGSYFGIVPTISASGRLLWPAVVAVKITDPA